MFRRLSEPLPLSEASLLSLRPALNAPVVNVSWLPIGPARAAIVAFAEEYGGIGIALAVRATESGQLGILRNRESIDFEVPLDQALEPLLAEAERMGFLFDEDLLGESAGLDARAEAAVVWADLQGGLDRLIPPPSPDPDDSASSDDHETAGPLAPSQAVEEMHYPELVLDDVAPLTLDDDFEDAEGVDRTDSTAALEVDGMDLAEADSDGATGGLDEDLDFAAADDDEDWSLDDDLLGEADLTQPTAPIPVAAQPPKPQPTPRVARLAPLVQVPIARAIQPPAPAPPPVPAAPAAAPDSPVQEPAPAAPPPRAPAQPESEPIAAPVRIAAAPPEPTPPVAPPAVPEQGVLSKFRQTDAGVGRRARRPGGSEVGRDRSAELARIPIVRVRRDVEASKRAPFLARLLSSF